jgi:hypothetical protein
MVEKLDPQPDKLEPKTTAEKMTELSVLFSEAETILSTEGRESAKLLLPKIYDELISLNKRDKGDYLTIWIWNPDGDLSEEEFNTLNLRRKLLSNAIGIMTSSGEVRHDLNEI